MDHLILKACTVWVV